MMVSNDLVPNPLDLELAYDPECELCRRLAAWLRTQPTYVRIRLTPASNADLQERAGGLLPLGEELVIIDGWGHVWIGGDAFLVAMWATRRYRAWSYRLRQGFVGDVAQRGFALLSSERKQISDLLSGHRNGGCINGQCTVPAHARARPTVSGDVSGD